MADEETPIELVKNRARPLLERLEAALEAGQISEAQWYDEVAAIIVPAYLAVEDPGGQAGSSGDAADWAYKRGLLADAFDRDGTFLDVGCANGYLMETLTHWVSELGHTIEPFGLDIAPALADLARGRLPHWAGRIFVGNALDWSPPTRYDYVRTGLEYVPRHRQRDLVAHLLEHMVAPGGRLIIGVFSEERDESRPGPSEAERVAAWGYPISGQTERPHLHDRRIVYRAFWIDRENGSEQRSGRRGEAWSALLGS